MYVVKKFLLNRDSVFEIIVIPHMVCHHKSIEVSWGGEKHETVLRLAKRY
jgi:hypothetical protein